MDNKEPLFFISALRWSFLMIVIFILFFLSFGFIYYSDISLDSKISSFFSFISSLGILVTVIIYILQKNNANRKEKNRQREISISYLNIFKSYANDLSEIVSKLIKLRDALKENDNPITEYHDRYNIYTFLVISEKGTMLSAISMFKFDNLSLSTIYSNSASINRDISNKYLFLYKHSLQLINFIENLIINISHDNSKSNILNSLGALSLDDSICNIELCMNTFDDYCNNL